PADLTDKMCKTLKALRQREQRDEHRKVLWDCICTRCKKDVIASANQFTRSRASCPDCSLSLGNKALAKKAHASKDVLIDPRDGMRCYAPRKVARLLHVDDTTVWTYAEEGHPLTGELLPTRPLKGAFNRTHRYFEAPKIDEAVKLQKALLS